MFISDLALTAWCRFCPRARRGLNLKPWGSSRKHPVWKGGFLPSPLHVWALSQGPLCDFLITGRFSGPAGVLSSLARPRAVVINVPGV